MNKGWISLHRKIQDHWLWENKESYSNIQAWIDILLTVNHTDKKVLIKSTLFDVKRGDSIMSLDTWANRWNWNKSKVRRFLKVLEVDGMIQLKNETQTTRITVCKYDSYQDIGNTNETEVKRKRNASETQVTPNNNVNNENNDNTTTIEAEDVLKRLETFAKNINPNTSWVIGMYRVHKLKEKNLTYVVKKYIDHALTLPDKSLPKSQDDFQNHCNNWTRIQIDNGKFSEYRTVKAKGTI